MRFNKQELIALASQTSSNFDREGVLVLKEKQDGFFRRSEGCSVRWFRLRGNLLFYLKGPEPWYEPMGVIILGKHKIHLQPQDENTHWPFHIVWENGVCYKMATFHETERTLWLKSIELAPYDGLHAQITELMEKLNKIRPMVDITSFRVQKGVVTDVNEVPLYELAISCDNLICDTLGRPPSPMAIVYLKYSKGPMVRYGSTEVIETCSNPSFSKTILFRASDGLTGDAIVKIVIYDVKELVSDTYVPIGFTALQLSMIQEAQRLRVALQSQDTKTKGFVTINGWSLEPSYSGASPSHNNEKNFIDIPPKILCHRRSHSLPPKLGLKLKFPSHGSLFKMNFLNSYQVTYRFHSGLGGDITVHEIMAEPKICFLLPIQLLDILIRREKDLLEGLLLIGDDYRHLQSRQMELVSIHVSLLKHYCRARQSLQSIQNLYFKASSRKEEASLEFAPTNLHLQRMWVYNDTLNKSGFHDVITVGAFTAHTHKSNRNGGLIRLVQQVKNISDANYATYNAAANRIQAEYDKVMAMSMLVQDLINYSQDLIRMKSNNREADVQMSIEGMKLKLKSIVSLWEPNVIEENLSFIGWTKLNGQHSTENQPSTVFRLTEQLSVFHNPDSPDSSCSSKETSPTSEHPGLSSSVPNIAPNGQNASINSGLEFENEYFNMDRRTTNLSFRSIRSPSRRMNDKQSSFDLYKRAGSLRNDYKNSASLEQVSYKKVKDGPKQKSLNISKELASCSHTLDSTLRRENQLYLNSISVNVERLIEVFAETALNLTNEEGNAKENLSVLQEGIKCGLDELSYWLRLSHTALRLRCEPMVWTKEHAALQIRRDTCFSQALTSVTAGLLCWLCSTPHEVVVKLLTSGLGPLCEFEGLLSLYSNEKPMWGDMVVAVEDLQTVVFSLSKVTSSSSAFPYVSGSRGTMTVYIPISDSLFASFNCKEQITFTVTAVFFNIGINEKATLAEALGETTPQYHSNCDNLDRLNKYYHRYCKVFLPDPTSANRTSSRTKPLEEVIENLRIVVHKKVPKNVEVLKLVAQATRLMNGIRFTSCKSAKDRTGMSVTLEQCNILSSEYHLAEQDGKKAINVIRREGCRRENTLKNIGIRKYAFTKKQVMSLPEEYRPPAGTYGSTQT